jgi:uncharacterized membrane protein YgcG
MNYEELLRRLPVQRSLRYCNSPAPAAVAAAPPSPPSPSSLGDISPSSLDGGWGNTPGAAPPAAPPPGMATQAGAMQGILSNLGIALSTGGGASAPTGAPSIAWNPSQSLAFSQKYQMEPTGLTPQGFVYGTHGLDNGGGGGGGGDGKYRVGASPLVPDEDAKTMVTEGPYMGWTDSGTTKGSKGALTSIIGYAKGFGVPTGLSNLGFTYSSNPMAATAHNNNIGEKHDVDLTNTFEGYYRAVNAAIPPAKGVPAFNPGEKAWSEMWGRANVYTTQHEGDASPKNMVAILGAGPNSEIDSGSNTSVEDLIGVNGKILLYSDNKPVKGYVTRDNEGKIIAQSHVAYNADGSVASVSGALVGTGFMKAGQKIISLITVTPSEGNIWAQLRAGVSPNTDLLVEAEHQAYVNGVANGENVDGISNRPATAYGVLAAAGYSQAANAAYGNAVNVAQMKANAEGTVGPITRANMELAEGVAVYDKKGNEKAPTLRWDLVTGKVLVLPGAVAPQPSSDGLVSVAPKNWIEWGDFVKMANSADFKGIGQILDSTERAKYIDVLQKAAELYVKAAEAAPSKFAIDNKLDGKEKEAIVAIINGAKTSGGTDWVKAKYNIEDMRRGINQALSMPLGTEYIPPYSSEIKPKIEDGAGRFNAVESVYNDMVKEYAPAVVAAVVDWGAALRKSYGEASVLAQEALNSYQVRLLQTYAKYKGDWSKIGPVMAKVVADAQSSAESMEGAPASILPMFSQTIFTTKAEIIPSNPNMSKIERLPNGSYLAQYAGKIFNIKIDGSWNRYISDGDKYVLVPESELVAEDAELANAIIAEIKNEGAAVVVPGKTEAKVESHLEEEMPLPYGAPSKPLRGELIHLKEGAITQVPTQQAEFTGMLTDNTSVKLPNVLNNPAIRVVGVADNLEAIGIEYGGHNWAVEKRVVDGKVVYAACWGGSCKPTIYDSYDSVVGAITSGKVKFSETEANDTWESLTKMYALKPVAVQYPSIQNLSPQQIVDNALATRSSWIEPKKAGYDPLKDSFWKTVVDSFSLLGISPSLELKSQTEKPLLTILAEADIKDSKRITGEAVIPFWFDPSNESLKVEAFPLQFRGVVKAVNTANAQVYGEKKLGEGIAYIGWLSAFATALKMQNLTELHDSLVATTKYDLDKIYNSTELSEAAKDSLFNINSTSRTIKSNDEVAKIFAQNGIKDDAYKVKGSATDLKYDLDKINNSKTIPQAVKDSLYDIAYGTDASARTRKSDSEITKILEQNNIPTEAYLRPEADILIDWVSKNIKPDKLIPFSAWTEPNANYTIEGIVDGAIVKLILTMEDVAIVALGPWMVQSLLRDVIQRTFAPATLITGEPAKAASLWVALKAIFSTTCTNGGCFSNALPAILSAIGDVTVKIAGGKIGGASLVTHLSSQPVDAETPSLMATAVSGKTIPYRGELTDEQMGTNKVDYGNAVIGPDGKMITVGDGELRDYIGKSKGIVVVQTISAGCRMCEQQFADARKAIGEKYGYDNPYITYVLLNKNDDGTLSLINSLVAQGAAFTLEGTPETQIIINGKLLSYKEGGFIDGYKSDFVGILEKIATEQGINIFKGGFEAKPVQGAIPPVVPISKGNANLILASAVSFVKYDPHTILPADAKEIGLPPIPIEPSKIDLEKLDPKSSDTIWLTCYKNYNIPVEEQQKYYDAGIMLYEDSLDSSNLGYFIPGEKKVSLNIPLLQELLSNDKSMVVERTFAHELSHYQWDTELSSGQKKAFAIDILRTIKDDPFSPLAQEMRDVVGLYSGHYEGDLSFLVDIDSMDFERWNPDGYTKSFIEWTANRIFNEMHSRIFEDTYRARRLNMQIPIPDNLKQYFVSGTMDNKPDAKPFDYQIFKSQLSGIGGSLPMLENKPVPGSYRVGPSNEVDGPPELSDQVVATFTGKGTVKGRGNAPDTDMTVFYAVVKNPDGSVGGLWYKDAGGKWQEGDYKYHPKTGEIETIVCDMGGACSLRASDWKEGIKYVVDSKWAMPTVSAPPTAGSLPKEKVWGAQPVEKGKDSDWWAFFKPVIFAVDSLMLQASGFTQDEIDSGIKKGYTIPQLKQIAEEANKDRNAPNIKKDGLLRYGEDTLKVQPEKPQHVSQEVTINTQYLAQDVVTPLVADATGKVETKKLSKSATLLGPSLELTSPGGTKFIFDDKGELVSATKDKFTDRSELNNGWERVDVTQLMKARLQLEKYGNEPPVPMDYTGKNDNYDITTAEGIWRTWYQDYKVPVELQQKIKDAGIRLNISELKAEYAAQYEETINIHKDENILGKIIREVLSGKDSNDYVINMAMPPEEGVIMLGGGPLASIGHEFGHFLYGRGSDEQHKQLIAASKTIPNYSEIKNRVISVLGYDADTISKVWSSAELDDRVANEIYASLFNKLFDSRSRDYGVDLKLVPDDVKDTFFKAFSIKDDKMTSLGLSYSDLVNGTGWAMDALLESGKTSQALDKVIEDSLYRSGTKEETAFDKEIIKWIRGEKGVERTIPSYSEVKGKLVQLAKDITDGKISLDGAPVDVMNAIAALAREMPELGAPEAKPMRGELIKDYKQRSLADTFLAQINAPAVGLLEQLGDEKTLPGVINTWNKNTLPPKPHQYTLAEREAILSKKPESTNDYWKYQYAKFETPIELQQKIYDAQPRIFLTSGMGVAMGGLAFANPLTMLITALGGKSPFVGTDSLMLVAKEGTPDDIAFTFAHESGHYLYNGLPQQDKAKVTESLLTLSSRTSMVSSVSDAYKRLYGDIIGGLKGQSAVDNETFAEIFATIMTGKKNEWGYLADARIGLKELMDFQSIVMPYINKGLPSTRLSEEYKTETMLNEIRQTIFHKESFDPTHVTEWDKQVLASFDAHKEGKDNGDGTWSTTFNYKDIKADLQKIIDANKSGMETVEGAPDELKPIGRTEVIREFPTEILEPIGKTEIIHLPIITSGVSSDIFAPKPTQEIIEPKTIQLIKDGKGGDFPRKDGIYYKGGSGGTVVEYFIERGAGDIPLSIWYRDPKGIWASENFSRVGTDVKIECTQGLCAFHAADLAAGVKYIIDKGWKSYEAPSGVMPPVTPPASSTESKPEYETRNGVRVLKPRDGMPKEGMKWDILAPAVSSEEGRLLRSLGFKQFEIQAGIEKGYSVPQLKQIADMASKEKAHPTILREGLLKWGEETLKVQPEMPQSLLNDIPTTKEMIAGIKDRQTLGTAGDLSPFENTALGIVVDNTDEQGNVAWGKVTNGIKGLIALANSGAYPLKGTPARLAKSEVTEIKPITATVGDMAAVMAGSAFGQGISLEPWRVEAEGGDNRLLPINGATVTPSKSPNAPGGKDVTYASGGIGYVLSFMDNGKLACVSIDIGGKGNPVILYPEQLRGDNKIECSGGQCINMSAGLKPGLDWADSYISSGMELPEGRVFRDKSEAEPLKQVVVPPAKAEVVTSADAVAVPITKWKAESLQDQSSGNKESILAGFNSYGDKLYVSIGQLKEYQETVGKDMFKLLWDSGGAHNVNKYIDSQKASEETMEDTFRDMTVNGFLKWDKGSWKGETVGVSGNVPSPQDVSKALKTEDGFKGWDFGFSGFANFLRDKNVPDVEIENRLCSVGCNNTVEVMKTIPPDHFMSNKEFGEKYGDSTLSRKIVPRIGDEYRMGEGKNDPRFATGITDYGLAAGTKQDNPWLGFSAQVLNRWTQFTMDLDKGMEPLNVKRSPEAERQAELAQAIIDNSTTIRLSGRGAKSDTELGAVLGVSTQSGLGIFSPPISTKAKEDVYKMYDSAGEELGVMYSTDNLHKQFMGGKQKPVGEDAGSDAMRLLAAATSGVVTVAKMVGWDVPITVNKMAIDTIQGQFGDAFKAATLTSAGILLSPLTQTATSAEFMGKGDWPRGLGEFTGFMIGMFVGPKEIFQAGRRVLNVIDPSRSTYRAGFVEISLPATIHKDMIDIAILTAQNMAMEKINEAYYRGEKLPSEYRIPTTQGIVRVRISPEAMVDPMPSLSHVTNNPGLITGLRHDGAFVVGDRGIGSPALSLFVTGVGSAGGTVHFGLRLKEGEVPYAIKTIVSPTEFTNIPPTVRNKLWWHKSTDAMKALTKAWLEGDFGEEFMIATAKFWHKAGNLVEYEEAAPFKMVFTAAEKKMLPGYVKYERIDKDGKLIPDGDNTTPVAREIPYTLMESPIEMANDKGIVVIPQYGTYKEYLTISRAAWDFAIENNRPLLPSLMDTYKRELISVQQQVKALLEGKLRVNVNLATPEDLLTTSSPFYLAEKGVEVQPLKQSMYDDYQMRLDEPNNVTGQMGGIIVRFPEPFPLGADHQPFKKVELSQFGRVGGLVRSGQTIIPIDFKKGELILAVAQTDPLPRGMTKNFMEVPPGAFQKMVRKNPKEKFLTHHSNNELADYKLVVNKQLNSGYAVTPSGELVNFFNNGKKGEGAIVLLDAIGKGARNLNAFDGWLVGYYKKFGFVEVGRKKSTQAGIPDTVDMEYKGPAMFDDLVDVAAKNLGHSAKWAGSVKKMFKNEGEPLTVWGDAGGAIDMFEVNNFTDAANHSLRHELGYNVAGNLLKYIGTLLSKRKDHSLPGAQVWIADVSGMGNPVLKNAWNDRYADGTHKMPEIAVWNRWNPRTERITVDVAVYHAIEKIAKDYPQLGIDMSKVTKYVGDDFYSRKNLLENEDVGFADRPAIPLDEVRNMGVERAILRDRMVASGQPIEITGPLYSTSEKISPIVEQMTLFAEALPGYVSLRQQKAFKDANALIESVKEGGAPTFVTVNVERIARDLGIDAETVAAYKFNPTELVKVMIEKVAEVEAELKKQEAAPVPTTAEIIGLNNLVEKMSKGKFEFTADELKLQIKFGKELLQMMEDKVAEMKQKGEGTQPVAQPPVQQTILTRDKNGVEVHEGDKLFYEKPDGTRVQVDLTIKDGGMSHEAIPYTIEGKETWLHNFRDTEGNAYWQVNRDRLVVEKVAQPKVAALDGVAKVALSQEQLDVIEAKIDNGSVSELEFKSFMADAIKKSDNVELSTIELDKAWKEYDGARKDVGVVIESPSLPRVPSELDEWFDTIWIRASKGENIETEYVGYLNRVYPKQYDMPTAIRMARSIMNEATKAGSIVDDIQTGRLSRIRDKASKGEDITDEYAQWSADVYKGFYTPEQVKQFAKVLMEEAGKEKAGLEDAQYQRLVDIRERAKKGEDISQEYAQWLEETYKGFYDEAQVATLTKELIDDSKLANTDSYLLKVMRDSGLVKIPKTLAEKVSDGTATEKEFKQYHVVQFKDTTGNRISSKRLQKDWETYQAGVREAAIDRGVAYDPYTYLLSRYRETGEKVLSDAVKEQYIKYRALEYPELAEQAQKAIDGVLSQAEYAAFIERAIDLTGLYPSTEQMSFVPLNRITLAMESAEWKINRARDSIARLNNMLVDTTKLSIDKITKTANDLNVILSSVARDASTYVNSKLYFVQDWADSIQIASQVANLLMQQIASKAWDKARTSLVKISNALAGYEVRLAKSVNTAWTKVSDTAYDRVGKPIGEAALKISTLTTDLLNTVRNATVENWDKAKVNISEKVDRLSTQVNDVYRSFGYVKDVMDSALSARIESVLNDARNNIENVRQFVNSTTVELLNENRAKLLAAMEDINNKVSPILEETGRFIKENSAMLSDAVNMAWGVRSAQFVDMATNISRDISDVGKKVAAQTSVLWSKSKAGIVASIESIEANVAELRKQLDYVGTQLDSISRARIEGILNDAQVNISSWKEMVQNTTVKLLDENRAKIVQLSVDINSKVTPMVEDASRAFKEGTAILGDAASMVWNVRSVQFIDMVNKISSDIADISNQLASQAVGTWNTSKALIIVNISKINADIVSLKQQLDYVGTQVDSLARARVESALDEAQSKLSVWGELVKNTTAKTLSDNRAKMVEVATDINNRITPIVDDISNKVGTAAWESYRKLSQISTNISNELQSFYNTVANYTRTYKDLTVAGIEARMTTLRAMIAEAKLVGDEVAILAKNNLISERVNDYYNDISSNLDIMFNGLKRAIDEKRADLSPALSRTVMDAIAMNDNAKKAVSGMIAEVALVSMAALREWNMKVVNPLIDVSAKIDSAIDNAALLTSLYAKGKLAEGQANVQKLAATLAPYIDDARYTASEIARLTKNNLLSEKVANSFNDVKINVDGLLKSLSDDISNGRADLSAKSQELVTKLLDANSKFNDIVSDTKLMASLISEAMVGAVDEAVFRSEMLMDNMGRAIDNLATQIKQSEFTQATINNINNGIDGFNGKVEELKLMSEFLKNAYSNKAHEKYTDMISKMGNAVGSLRKFAIEIQGKTGAALGAVQARWAALLDDIKLYMSASKYNFGEYKNDLKQGEVLGATNVRKSNKADAVNQYKQAYVRIQEQIARERIKQGQWMRDAAKVFDDNPRLADRMRDATISATEMHNLFDGILPKDILDNEIARIEAIKASKGTVGDIPSKLLDEARRARRTDEPRVAPFKPSISVLVPATIPDRVDAGGRPRDFLTSSRMILAERKEPRPSVTPRPEPRPVPAIRPEPRPVPAIRPEPRPEPNPRPEPRPDGGRGDGGRGGGGRGGGERGGGDRGGGGRGGGGRGGGGRGGGTGGGIRSFPVIPKEKKRTWDSLTREEKLASIVWKQGWAFWCLPPMYSQKDLIYSNKPFAGTKIHSGPKSAYKSVAKVKGAQLPDRIDIDLGIMDLSFVRDKDSKDVKVFYRADPLQKTTGQGPSNVPETLTHRTGHVITQVSSVG